MMNKITILGSGTSTGVPILGCSCSVCQSRDLRNKRFRTSVIIELPNAQRILVDATPDLRTQLLTNKITDVNAIIITHDHADHTHGMDDLRPFGFKHKKALPVFTDDHTIQSLTLKFPYIFDRKNSYQDKPILGGGIPLLDLHQVSVGKHKILDQDFEFFALPHGHGDTLGVHHGKMAYLVDCRTIPDETITRFKLAQLDLLIIDCLRPQPHQTHLHFELTMEYIERIGLKKAVLTHMGHEWDYLELLSQIEKRGVKNTFPAIDGQTFLYSNT